MVPAAFGMLGPFFAAFIHVTSELAFISNSARLLPRHHNRKAARQFDDL
jgi:cation transport ATPase